MTIEPASIADQHDRLSVLRSHSRFARRQLDANPDLARFLAETQTSPLNLLFSEQQLRSSLEAPGSATDGELRARLRHLRNRVLLAVMARDLNGTADLAQVTHTLSALADACLAAAQSQLHASLVKIYGEPVGESGRPQQLMVIAMGKLGGRELNASSDIDLVFVYPEDGSTTGARSISNHEFFALLARQLSATLSETSADGFAFRVDARLRPYGDSGALAVSLAMLEEYLVTQARPWERFALIKARVVTGDRGDEFEALRRPCVFRRYLDFAALANLRAVHAQIRAEVERKDRADDIKLGPGGIREIEFIAQVFQLIRGGRDAALQTRATLPVLALLNEKRLLPARAVHELCAAYVFLRDLEHRIQYLDDQQTHRLPAAEEDRTKIAHAMGFDSYNAFASALERHRAQVSTQFAHVFANSTEGNATHAAAAPLAQLWQQAISDDLARAQLTELRFSDAAQTLSLLQSLRASSRYRALPESSRVRLDALAPLMIEAAARQPNPDATLARMIDFIEAVSRRESYLALLAEHPQTLDKIAALVAASRWAADYLRQHPILLDELLDPRILSEQPDWVRLAAELDARLAEADGDTERLMDTLRHFKHAQIFRLVLKDLNGSLTLERLSDHLSALADLLLKKSLTLVWSLLPNKHSAHARFAVIGFGKLGGKELGYGSDLDIVFLYDDAASQAQETYARFAQRLNTWFNAYTGAGVLYQTDLRLRPDGASGLLVSPIDAFESYQREHAWVWEHQALSRARYCAGEPGVGQKFEALRIAVLRMPRDRVKLKTEVLAMRDKMRAEQRARSGLFDIKGDLGGLIDVEFAVQYLVLAYSNEYEELTLNSGNIALLSACAARGLIGRDTAHQAAAAYRELRRLQHGSWLNQERHARIAPEIAAPLARAVKDLWRETFGV